MHQIGYQLFVSLWQVQLLNLKRFTIDKVTAAFSFSTITVASNFGSIDSLQNCIVLFEAYQLQDSYSNRSFQAATAAFDVCQG